MHERMSKETARMAFKARQKAGLRQSAFAKLLGVDQSTVSRWEKGADMRPDHYKRLLELARDQAAESDEFYDRQLGHELAEAIPVEGYVGAGALVFQDEHDTVTAHVDRVEPPRKSDEMVAVFVRGDSMYPAYRDGDIIYFRQFEGDIDRLLGQECLVRTEDHKRMIKILERGDAAGTHNLISYNAPPIRDQIVVSAFPVAFIKRKAYA